MGLNLFVARNNKTLGPFPEEQVRELYAKGKIQPQDHLWAEGFDSWKPASEYFGKSGAAGAADREGPVVAAEVPPAVSARIEDGAPPSRKSRKRSPEIDVAGSLYESEKRLTLIAYIFAGLFWFFLALAWIVPAVALLFRSGVLAALSFLVVSLLPFAFMVGFFFLSMFLSELFFRAKLYGESVLVSKKQYPKLHSALRNASESLGLGEPPLMFVVNSSGSINALAVRFLKNRYVILYGSLVDLYLDKDSDADELRFIIGHELGHHAAGHCHWFREMFLGPAKFIPLLGLALSRAREFTADRLGFLVAGGFEGSARGLASLAHGSRALNNITNTEAFEHQEAERPGLVAFMDQLFATHPRLSLRVKTLREFAEKD